MSFGKQLLVGLVAIVLAGWAQPSSALTVADPHAQTESSAAAHDEHHAEEPNPLIFSVDLAIWTAVVFVLLLTILRKFAWGPIVEALEHREQGIAENIAAAERQNAEAKHLLAEYEQRLAGASNQVRELLEEARRDAEFTKGEILAEAKAAAQAEHDRAMRDIRNAIDGALKDLSELSAHLAVDLAGKVVSERLDSVDHARLVREAMSRFPDRIAQN